MVSGQVRVCGCTSGEGVWMQILEGKVREVSNQPQ